MSTEPIGGSIVKLEQVRRFLRVTHAEDDVLLQDLIEQAEDECRTFLNRRSLPRRGEQKEDPLDSNTVPDWNSNLLDSNHHFPYREAVSDSEDLATPVRGGIYLIVQAMYEGKDAAELETVRRAAEVKWQPYRVGLGVSTVLAQKLRHRIDVQALIVTKDETTGRDTEDWQSILGSADDLIPAEIVPSSGSEFIAAAAAQARVNTRITMREDSRILPSMRIWHPATNTLYAIRAILPDPSLRRWMTIMCESGVSDG